MSTWLPSTALPGTWQQFWQGHTTAMGGLVRVNGVSYMFMGNPGIILTVPNGNQGTLSTVQGFELALQQTKLEVTPTRSRFTLEGGGIELVAEFFSPVEPGDLKRQSIPLSYVLLSARSIDGHPHDVQIYADISGEWCSADDGQQITWAPSQVGSGVQALQVWSVQLANQQPLTEQNQQAAWGSTVWATPSGGGLTYQSGQDVVVRAQFVSNGKLANTNDTNYRAIGNNWPVFAFCADLGQVSGAAKTVPLSIGLVRTPAVSYQGQNLQPLWTAKFSTWQDMLAFFLGDLAAAQRRADRLDARVPGTPGRPAARRTPGCARSPCGRPTAGPSWSPGRAASRGRSSRRFPATGTSPPSTCCTRRRRSGSTPTPGTWPCCWSRCSPTPSRVCGRRPSPRTTWVPPTRWPTATMTAAARTCRSRSPATCSSWWPRTCSRRRRRPRRSPPRTTKILKQWADYLVANLPDPGFQNQTDDFAGPIAHSVNLALKGIIAVAAMGEIAKAAGNAADAASYTAQARTFIAYWASHAQDPSAPHLDLTYSGSGGGDGTWGTTYNGFADRLLGTGLVPASVLAEQAAWYPQYPTCSGCRCRCRTATPSPTGNCSRPRGCPATRSSSSSSSRCTRTPTPRPAGCRSATCTIRSAAGRRASRPGRCRAVSSRCSPCGTGPKPVPVPGAMIFVVRARSAPSAPALP